MSTDKGHGSEIGGLVTEIGGPKTDADGNLINSITGKVHTHNASGELAEGYANRNELIDAGTAINHTHRITVRAFGSEDDVTVQQGLEPPTRYAEQENARLAYLDGPRTSTPQQPATGSTPTTPPTTTTSAGVAVHDFTADIRKNNGQFKATLALVEGGVFVKFRTPKTQPAGASGGRVNILTSNQASQQSLRYSKIVGAEITPILDPSGKPLEANGLNLNIGVGGSDPQAVADFPLDTEVGVLVVPVGLQLTAAGVATIEAEVQMPFRGAQWAQTTWWD